MEVDILEFLVPVENNKTLFVWDIEPTFSEAHIYEGLYSVFSSFGPLYLCKVCPNAAVHRPGFYCLIKFYSSAQALKAQRHTDGQTLFQSTPLKVRLSSKQTPAFLSKSTPLSQVRCLDLANHCLGFNGWSSEIITLKDLSDSSNDDDSAVDGEQTLRLGCLLQLTFPRHDKRTRAAAVMEDTFACTGPEVPIQRRCRLQRLVREKALVQAFSAVLLVLLGDGRVMVEVRQTPDQILPEEAEEGVIQVNEFSWADFPADEEGEDEEAEWDLTVS